MLPEQVEAFWGYSIEYKSEGKTYNWFYREYDKALKDYKKLASVMKMNDYMALWHMLCATDDKGTLYGLLNTEEPELYRTLLLSHHV